ncbi:Uncharacterised protein [Cytobacillus firmus]|nr:Uncharacterised protein [Cytobacillus firmus]
MEAEIWTSGKTHLEELYIKRNSSFIFALIQHRHSTKEARV